MEPQTWSEKASPPPIPSPVPQPEPLGGVVPHPTPAERPPCRYVTLWCPDSSTCKESRTQVVGASMYMVVDQLQTRMACHGTDTHAMTWDLACGIVLFHEVTVWASRSTPPMTQECEADSAERRHDGDGGKGRSSSANSGGKGAHFHCHWPGVTLNCVR